MKPRQRRGAVIVEAALVVLLALIILIGVIDFGQVLLLHQGLVERVRSGARYGVVHDRDGDTSAAMERIRNVVRFGNSAGTRGSSLGIFGVTEQNVFVTRDSIGGNVGDEGADRIVVEIRGYRFHFLTPGLAGQYEAKLIRHAITAENLGCAVDCT